MKDATQGGSAFPAGLVQPAGAYRFSADALYLAHFAVTAVSALPVPAHPVILDLGTGCGIVALATLRLLDRVHGSVCHTSWQSAWRGVGVDCQPCLVEAARDNAARLGLGERFVALCADVSEPSTLASLPCGRAQLLVCNPPWRLEGHGLLPPSPVRRTALFGTSDTLLHFARAAACLLAPHGVACFVVGTERLPALRTALATAGLTVQLELPVTTHEDSPPPFTLVEVTRYESS